MIFASETSTASSSGGMGMMLIWIVVLVALMYFMMIRPQKKEQKRMQSMLSDLAVGDAIVTNSGFLRNGHQYYRRRCDREFGNNRNCRIPMRKSAIAAVEKPEEAGGCREGDEEGHQDGKGRDKKEIKEKRKVHRTGWPEGSPVLWIFYSGRRFGRSFLRFFVENSVILKYHITYIGPAGRRTEWKEKRGIAMEYKIGLIRGDGIGPEIVNEAKKVLDAVCEKYGHTFHYSDMLLGGASIDATGLPLTEETVAEAKTCDAVLMGSIGGDAATSPWYRLEPSRRPEAGLLGIRKALNLFANVRPAYLYDELKAACPLRDEVIGKGF